MNRGRNLDADACLEPGDTVGAYRIESVLGEGGMGWVYRAVDSLGEEVALKFVKGSLVGDHVLLRRFDREARTAARIEHPHLVPVLDTGEHEGIPWMAQQFIRGGSLDEKLKSEGPLAIDFAVKLCLEVARGLEALHREGLVHRDLKPANILLDESGSAHISDFGLAKDNEASVLTKPGQAVGSLDYMAPEQIRGEEVTPLTDVYALGCVMFECLSGAPPFADRNGAMQILWAHLRDEPPDPCSNREDVPEGLSWPITRALEKEPEKRPQGATAFARMVQVSAGGRLS